MLRAGAAHLSRHTVLGSRDSSLPRRRVVFWTATLLLLNVSHLLMREGLRLVRRRGYNLRHMVIAGTAVECERLLQSLNLHRHLGHRVVALYPMDHAASSSVRSA